MGLTIKEIDNAKLRVKPYKLADVGGLCLAIKPDGSKLWWYRYRFGGGEKTLSLGESPLIGLKEARDRHLAARQKLAADVEPMAERKAELEAKLKKAEEGQRAG